MSVSSGFSRQAFENQFDIRPRIAVIGVGGAGGNAVNNMIRLKLEGVDFYAANTDAQALHQSMVLMENRIQLGLGVTQGLGAGSKPDVGRASAEESIEDVLRHVEGNNMLFVTAGMGGGTGTGAAPVIARAAREKGILTVGVVTKPFQFEGTKRMRAAEMGIEELQMHVDTLIVIPNQNLFRVSNEATTFADAFKMADDVLYSGVRSVTDLMLMPGLINLDFADVRTVMEAKGKAMMGTGEEEGENRASKAAANAIANPLLEDVSLATSQAVLISISGGTDMTLHEVDEAANIIRQNVQPESQIIFGAVYDEKLTKRFRVSIIATGIGEENTSHSVNHLYQHSHTTGHGIKNDQHFSKGAPPLPSYPTHPSSPFFTGGNNVSSHTHAIEGANKNTINEDAQGYYTNPSQDHSSSGANYAMTGAGNHTTPYATRDAAQVSSSAFHQQDLGYQHDGIDAKNTAPAPIDPKQETAKLATQRKKSQSILNRFAAGITGRNRVEEDQKNDMGINRGSHGGGTIVGGGSSKSFDDSGDNSLDIPAFLRRNH